MCVLIAYTVDCSCIAGSKHFKNIFNKTFNCCLDTSVLLQHNYYLLSDETLLLLLAQWTHFISTLLSVLSLTGA